jgi:hypothetical protein
MRESENVFYSAKVYSTGGLGDGASSAGNLRLAIFRRVMKIPAGGLR